MSTSSDTARSGDYVGLVRRNPDFRYLWFGQIVSLLGDWLNLIASASLVSSLTQSGAAVGGLFVLRMVAPFLVSPLAGVVADRYDRKKLLILTDLVRGVVVLGFLLVRRADQVWLLYALTGLQLGVSGFFFPARNAILPSTVGRHELGAANALSSATWSVMLALGTALGGFVAGGLGVYPAFVMDALTFLASAAILSRIGYRKPVALEPEERSVGAAFRQYVVGLDYLRRHTGVFVMALHKAAVSLTTSGGFQVIQVALAEQVFVIGEGGAISMGIMFAVVGVGTGIGPIVMRRYTGDRERALRLAIGAGYGMAAAGVVLTATLANFGLVLAGILLRGVGGGIVWVFSTQLLLQMVPDQVRGRVFATEFALFTLASAAGAAASGWALDFPPVGLVGALWWMAGLAAVPAVLWAWWLGREGRAVPPVRKMISD